jgi:hypothetical protein
VEPAIRAIRGLGSGEGRKSLWLGVELRELAFERVFLGDAAAFAFFERLANHRRTFRRPLDTGPARAVSSPAGRRATVVGRPECLGSYTKRGSGTPLPWISIKGVIHRYPSLADFNATAIAIGVVAEDAEQESILETTTGVDANLVADSDWVFLGFDVADGSTSGLSNCGYDASQARILRPVWGPRLNAHGLFVDIADALSFRRLTNEQVPAHAPFYVYGIWMIGSDAQHQAP